MKNDDAGLLELEVKPMMSLENEGLVKLIDYGAN